MTEKREVGYVIVAKDLASKVLGKAKKRVNKFVRDVNKEFKRNLAGGFKEFNRVARFAIAGVLAATVTFGATFQQKMQDVRAISDLTSTEFIKLKKTAEDLGRTTVFSASQAAAAFENLGRAGFSVREQLQAVKPTLDLAAAAGVGLAEASDIMANTIRAFALEASDAGQIANVFAKAIASSNTDLLTLQESLKLVAPVATAAGISLTEITAAVGRLADFGLKGTISGTALRRMLISLQDPATQAKKAFKDLGLSQAIAEDGSLSLIKTLKQLEKAGVTGGQIFQLFGQRAGPALQALLIAGSDSLEEFKERLDDVGEAAAKASKIRLDSLFGDFRQFLSKVEIIGIQVFDKALGPLFRGILKEINTGLNSIAVSGDIGTEIAKIADQVLKVSESIVIGFGKGVKFILDTVIPTVISLVNFMGKTFNELPDVIKSVGFVGFFLLGTKGKVALLAVTALFSKISEEAERARFRSTAALKVFMKTDFKSQPLNEIRRQLLLVEESLGELNEQNNDSFIFNKDAIREESKTLALVIIKMRKAIEEKEKLLKKEGGGDNSFKEIGNSAGGMTVKVVKAIRTIRGEFKNLREGISISTAKSMEGLTEKTIEELEKMKDAAVRGSREREAISKELVVKSKLLQAELTKVGILELKKRLGAAEKGSRRFKAIDFQIAKLNAAAIKRLTKLDFKEIQKRISTAKKGGIEIFRLRAALSKKLEPLIEKFGDKTLFELRRIKRAHATTGEEILAIERLIKLKLAQEDKTRAEQLVAGFSGAVAKIESEMESINALGEETAKVLQNSMQAGFFDIFSGNISNLKNTWQDFMGSMLQTFQTTAAKIASNQVMKALFEDGGSKGAFGKALGVGVGLGVVSAGAQQGGGRGILTGAAGGAIAGATLGSSGGAAGIAAGALAGAIGGGLVAAFSAADKSAQKLAESINKNLVNKFSASMNSTLRALNKLNAKTKERTADLVALNAVREKEVEQLEAIKKESKSLTKELGGVMKTGQKEFGNFSKVMKDGFKDNTKDVQGQLDKVKELFAGASDDAFKFVLANEIESAEKARDKLKDAIDTFNAGIDAAKQKIIELRNRINEIQLLKKETTSAINADIKTIRLSMQTTAEQFKTFTNDVDGIKSKLGEIDKIPFKQLTDADIALRTKLTEELRTALKSQLAAGEKVFGDIEGLIKEQGKIEAELKKIGLDLNATGLKKADQERLIGEQEKANKALSDVKGELVRSRSELAAVGLVETTVENLRNDTISELETLRESSESFYDKSIRLYTSIAKNTFAQVREFRVVNSQLTLFLTGFGQFLNAQLTGRKEDIARANKTITQGQAQIKSQEQAGLMLRALSDLMGRIPDLPEDLQKAIDNKSIDVNEIFAGANKEILDKFAKGDISLEQMTGKLGEILRFLVDRGLLEGFGVETIGPKDIEAIFKFIAGVGARAGTTEFSTEGAIDPRLAGFTKKVEKGNNDNFLLRAPRATESAPVATASQPQEFKFTVNVGDTKFEIGEIVSGMDEQELEEFFLKVAKTNQGQIVSALSSALEKFKDKTFTKTGRTQ